MARRDYADAGELTPIERRLARLCQAINERPALKRLQTGYHRAFGQRWVRAVSHNLLETYGLEGVEAMRPERGVIICSNHRSFFDMYVISAVLRNSRAPWMGDLYFPVRSPFFYETWSGLAVNLLMSGGAMYPPIFRDPSKAELNKASVERVVELLQQPGVVVGMHPEGTRNKGDNRYRLLPAQPGVGQMALRANVPVLPIWIEGLGNNLVQQVASNFRNGEHRGEPIRLSFGAPVDLEDLRARPPRTVLYKRAADRILDAIRALGAGLAPAGQPRR